MIKGAKKLLKYAVIAAAVIAAVSVIFAYSIRDVKVVGASVDEIVGFNISGLSLNGKVKVYNGGFLPIKVDKITYNVTIGEVRGATGRGEIIGGAVMAKETKLFPFTIKIEWVPSINTAIELLLANKTYADVKGIVQVLEYKGLVKLKIPFSAKINIKGYIEQFVMENPSIELEGMIGDIAGIVGGIAGDVSDEVKEGAKGGLGILIDNLGNLS